MYLPISDRERLGKMWAHCRMKQRTWLHRSMKRLKYWMPSLPQLYKQEQPYGTAGLRHQGKNGARKMQPWWEDKVRILSKLSINKSIGSDEMRSWVLRELIVVARALSVIFLWSWQLEVLEDWRNVNVSFFKMGKKEYLGNDRLVSLTSIPGNVMEQLILENISKHVKGKKIITSSQCGFTKGKSSLANLILQWNDQCGRWGKSDGCCLPWLQ